MPIGADRTLARLLGQLYTEVFQRKSSNPNKPLTTSSHTSDDVPVTEKVKDRLLSEDAVYVWGPNGSQPWIGAEAMPVGYTGDAAARWGMEGVWQA